MEVIKFRLRNLFLAFSLSLFTCSAQAVVVNGKDWLQVSNTANATWDEFDAIFDTATGSCDVAGCLLGGVTDLTGYTWASNTEVIALFDHFVTSSGLNPTNTDQFSPLPTNAADPFFVDFNPTFFDPDNIQTLGWTRESGCNGCGTYLALNARIAARDATFDFAVTEINLAASERFDIIGGWVYRSASPVPVPAAVWLFSAGFLGIIGIARRRKLR